MLPAVALCLGVVPFEMHSLDEAIEATPVWITRARLHGSGAAEG
jgi:hypothetical protein